MARSALPRPRSRPRTAALLIVLACALVAAGVGIWFVAQRRSGPTPVSGEQETGPITTIDDLLQDPGAGHGRLQFVDPHNPARVERELEYERLDPLPQGRFALTQPRAWVYPKDGGVWYVTASRGKIKKPPKSNEVESGQFEGGVVARFYPARHASRGQGPTPASHPVNPETETPSIIAQTESLAFDRSTGEFTTDDRINISTTDWEVQGVGLHAAFNDIKQRPEPSTLLRGEYAIFRNRARPRRAVSPTSAESEPGAQAAQGAPGDGGGETKPKEEQYHVDFHDSVVLVHRGRSVEADTLEIWARLIDGRFAPGAFGEKASAAVDAVPPEPGENAPERAGAGAPQSPAVSPSQPDGPINHSPEAGPHAISVRDTVLSMRHPVAGSPAPLMVVQDDDSLLLWTGPVTMTPLDTPPDQLSRDQVAIRFGAAQSRQVRLADAARGSIGRCTTVEYGATTRALILNGPGERGVWLNDPKAGSLTASRFEHNLATGDAHVPGPGLITDKTGIKQIAWNDQADFLFDMKRTRTNRGSDQIELGSLTEAMFTGGAVASDDRSMAAADFLHAWLGRSESDNGATVLQRVVLDGRAHGQKRGKNQGELDHLRAGRIDVAFTPNPDGRNTYPSVLTATDSVEASRTELIRSRGSSNPPDRQSGDAQLRTSTLTADMLEADMRIDPLDAKEKKVEISTATAQGRVRFSRDDGIAAFADLMRADVVKKIIDLSSQSEQVLLSQGAARITGTQARLDGGRDALDVFGPGRFDREATAGENAIAAKADSGADHGDRHAAKASTAHVTWLKSMHFDNTSGLVQCDGQTLATSISDDGLMLNKAEGERFVLHLAPDTGPHPARASVRAPLSAAGDVAFDRRVTLAEAFGKPAADGAPPQPAKVESRRYAAPLDGDTERKLERLLYVEGMTITADNQAGLFSVPTAGRALVVDRTERAASGAARSDPAEPPVIFPENSSQSRGNSLFVWTGSMRMDHGAGRLEMHDGVRLVHTPLGDGQPMTLDANSLTALFRAGGAPGEKRPAAEQQHLTRALARGDVTAETDGGQMKLLAQDLDYDALNRTIDASAPDDDQVTLFDQRKASPLVARKLHWDLLKDKVTVIEPKAITVPIKK